MASKDNTKRNDLPYAEYGKLFLPLDATDFERLDRSEDGFSREHYGLYNNKLAIYTGKWDPPLPFTSRGKGYGNSTAALIEHPSKRDYFLFIQLQQRKECEPLYRNEVSIPIQARDRKYNQARLTEISKKQIETILDDGLALYNSLLFRRGDQVQLKDYYLYNEKNLIDPRNILPEIHPHDVEYLPRTSDGLDQNLKDGLTNLFVYYFGPDARKEVAAGKRIPAIILVMSGLKEEEKLRYMEVIQAELFRITGVITFCLDYISEPSYDFYFCSETPPDWMFTNPIKLNEPKLRELSQDPNGFSRFWSKVPDERKKDPNLVKYLGKGIPWKDALQIVSIPGSLEELSSIDVAGFLLRNWVEMDKEDQYKAIIWTLDHYQVINLIVEEAPQYLKESRFRLDLFYKILIKATEYFKGNLASYYQFHSLIKKQPLDAPKLDVLLKESIKACSPDCLDSELDPILKADLFSDLVELGINEQVQFNNDLPVINAVFSRPGSALFHAINHAKKQGHWNKKTFSLLVEIIIQEDIWTTNAQNELISQTGIQLPDIFITRVEKFISDKNRREEFEKLPREQRGTFLKKLLNTEPNRISSLFARQNFDLFIKLREVCLKTCSLGGVESLRFSAWWLKVLSGAGDDVFAKDYSELISIYKASENLRIKKTEDQAIDFLLRGKPSGSVNSLTQACEILELKDLNERILDIWKELDEGIPTADIAGLVDRLPASDVRLVQLVKNHANLQQEEQILRLPGEKAIIWLRATSKDSLRKRYINSAGEDELYQILLKLNLPTPEFFMEVMIRDDSAFPVGMSWSEYKEKLNAFYNHCIERKVDIGPFALEFVKIANLFTFPVGNNTNHIYGLTHLVERLIDKEQMDVVLSSKELRLFLTYVLGAKGDQYIINNASRILTSHLDSLIGRLQDLNNDEVWSLHLAYKIIGKDDNSIQAITDEGRKRLDQWNRAYENLKVRSHQIAPAKPTVETRDVDGKKEILSSDSSTPVVATTASFSPPAEEENAPVSAADSKTNNSINPISVKDEVTGHRNLPSTDAGLADHSTTSATFVAGNNKDDSTVSNPKPVIDEPLRTKTKTENITREHYTQDAHSKTGIETYSNTGSTAEDADKTLIQHHQDPSQTIKSLKLLSSTAANDLTKKKGAQPDAWNPNHNRGISNYPVTERYRQTYLSEHPVESSRNNGKTLEKILIIIIIIMLLVMAALLLFGWYLPGGYKLIRLLR